MRGFCGQICGLVAVLTATTLLGFALVEGAAPALAASGGYVFDGGTPRERATVRAALAASSFDWSLVPARVTIHITRQSDSYASRGHIWLGSRMLDQGRSGWGIVQHEYAHQLDFYLFDARIRASLNAALNGKRWWPGQRPGRHDQYGAERFASTLSWAYWPSPHNALIREARAEATAMAPGRFRRLLSRLLVSR
jgi:hypothetical protein